MGLLKQIFFYIIYSLSIISLGLIVIISLLWPRDNLLSYQMFIFVPMAVTLFLLIFWIWEKCWKKIKNVDFIVFILFVLFLTSLYFISCIGRNEPASLVDYGILYDNAMELAKGNNIINREYFLMYSNNIKPMLFLSIIFKMAFYFGINDPFYFALILSVLEVGAAVLGTFILIENKEEDKKYRIPILFFYICCLPIWASTQAFYTDSMSFCIAIVIIALLKLAIIEEKILKKALISFGAGILLAIGLSIKITILITILSALIICFLAKEKKINKVCIPSCIFISGYIFASFIINGFAESYEITNAAKETCDPILAWVALGLKGDGSYAENREFIQYLHLFSDKNEKSEICKQYLKSNFLSFFDIDHIFSKIRCNYSSGHLGNTDFTYYAKYQNNILWELFAPWGKHYWRTSQISFCYVQTMYIVCFIGNIISVIRYITNKRIFYLKMITDLSMLGYFIFLMLWEANNRQLYNHIPIMILAGLLNANEIIKFLNQDILKKIIYKNRKNYDL